MESQLSLCYHKDGLLRPVICTVLYLRIAGAMGDFALKVRDAVNMSPTKAL